jgi:hypothetical protein
MQPYVEAYPVGIKVVVAPRPDLEEFRRNWRWHNPLAETQLQYAGTVARVKTVGFYHGRDILYVLKKIPGVWHEAYLRSAG